MAKPIREIRPNEQNNVHIEKPRTLDISRINNNLESQAASGHKYPEVPFEHKTEQARLEDQFKELERKANELKKEGERLKKEREQSSQSFWEQVDDFKRWKEGMASYQPDQSTVRDSNPFRGMIGDSNPFRRMVGNGQYSGDFTPKPEEKFSSFEGFDAPFSEQRSGDSTHKSKNFEAKRLENELKILMRGKFGDEIMKSDLLKNLGTEKTDTEVTKIDKGNPSVYRDGNTYFVTYDERNAQGYFGANKDLSKIRCQVDDGLLRELEAKAAYVKWDLPIVYRIHLEKPEGEAQILVTDDEAAVGKRMKDGWAVREVIERQKGFSLVDVRKNELPSNNEIMSDGKKEKIQDKFSDWSDTEKYEAPPPPYPGHEGMTLNSDMKKTVYETYDLPPAYEKRITYLAKKAVRKVWTFLSSDKQQRIGLDNRQSGQWQSDLQGYQQDKKDKKSDILYPEGYGAPPPYPGLDRVASSADTQKKAEIESKSPDMLDMVHEKRESPPVYPDYETTIPIADTQKKAEIESKSPGMLDIVQEHPEAPPAYDESWLKEFSVSNYSQRKQDWLGLSSDKNKKTKKTKNLVFKPFTFRDRKSVV